MKKLMPTSPKKLGLLLNIAGILILGLKYLRISFFVRIYAMPDISSTLINVAWSCLFFGFVLQYVDTK